MAKGWNHDQAKKMADLYAKLNEAQTTLQNTLIQNAQFAEKLAEAQGHYEDVENALAGYGDPNRPAYERVNLLLSQLAEAQKANKEAEAEFLKQLALTKEAQKRIEELEKENNELENRLSDFQQCY